MNVAAAVAEERNRLADFLEALTPGQLQTPSCCQGWTVLQAGAHLLAGPLKGVKGSLPNLVRAGFRPNKANELSARELAEMGPAEVVAQLRNIAHHPFVPPGFPPDAPLIDVTLHGQDMSRPFGIDLDVPIERWEPSLDSALSKRYNIVNTSGALKGLSFEATDLGWAAGFGPVVRGDARDLAHVMWGRPQALDALDGDGVAQLRSRLG